MSDTDQSYIDAWDSPTVVIEGGGASPAETAQAATEAVQQLAEVAEQLGNKAAEHSAAEFSAAWDKH